MLAGGQSLVPLLNMRFARPTVLVDVNRVAGLDRLSEVNNVVRVGALVRQAAFGASSLIRERAPLAAECVPFIGHYVTRNRGTVGGSIAHADARAELPLALTAAGGRVVIHSPGGGARCRRRRSSSRTSRRSSSPPSSSPRRRGRPQARAPGSRSRSLRSEEATMPLAWPRAACGRGRQGGRYADRGRRGRRPPPPAARGRRARGRRGRRRRAAARRPVRRPRRQSIPPTRSTRPPPISGT